jgi:uncharacterized protein DUF6459
MTAVVPDPILAPAAGWPRLRALPIPDTEPEPDTVPYAAHPASPADQRQPPLALALVTAPQERPTSAFDRFGPRPTATSDLPDPHAWTRRLVQAVMEVLTGVRPVAQLARWSTLDVYDGLRRRCALATGRPAPARRAVVRTVRVCLPADGVVEASAVVVARGRVQAVALRLEGIDGRWRMTALELG